MFKLFKERNRCFSVDEAIFHEWVDALAGSIGSRCALKCPDWQMPGLRLLPHAFAESRKRPLLRKKMMHGRAVIDRQIATVMAATRR